MEIFKYCRFFLIAILLANVYSFETAEKESSAGKNNFSKSKVS